MDKKNLQQRAGGKMHNLIVPTNPQRTQNNFSGAQIQAQGNGIGGSNRVRLNLNFSEGFLYIQDDKSQEHEYGNGNGYTLKSSERLPVHFDIQVLAYLLCIAQESNVIEFSPRQLLLACGKGDSGQDYQRLKESFKRWTATTSHFEGSYYVTKDHYETRTFKIIDEFKLERGRCKVVINREFWLSHQENYSCWFAFSEFRDLRSFELRVSQMIVPKLDKNANFEIDSMKMGVKTPRKVRKPSDMLGPLKKVWEKIKKTVEGLANIELGVNGRGKAKNAVFSKAEQTPQRVATPAVTETVQQEEPTLRREETAPAPPMAIETEVKELQTIPTAPETITAVEAQVIEVSQTVEARVEQIEPALQVKIQVSQEQPEVVQESEIIADIAQVPAETGLSDIPESEVRESSETSPPLVQIAEITPKPAITPPSSPRAQIVKPTPEPTITPPLPLLAQITKLTEPPAQMSEPTLLYLALTGSIEVMSKQRLREYLQQMPRVWQDQYELSSLEEQRAIEEMVCGLRAIIIEITKEEPGKANPGDFKRICKVLGENDGKHILDVARYFPHFRAQYQAMSNKEKLWENFAGFFVQAVRREYNSMRTYI